MLARFTGKAGGVDDLHIAEYPGPVGLHEADEIEKNITDVLVERIVSGLTSSVGSARSGSQAARDPRAIVYTGTAEEVDRYFLAQGWSDGLPVVPPTLARIEAFLKHTRRKPEEVIGVLLPDNRAATVWSVAVNGVMAGCKPEYMPILVALAEAMCDPDYGVEHSGNTPGAETLIVLNGPIIKQLGFNYTHSAWESDLKIIHFGPQTLGTYSGTAGGVANQHYEAKTSADLAFTYTINKNMKFSFGGNNIFNVHPTTQNPDETDNGFKYESVQFGLNGASYFGRLYVKF